MKKRKTKRAKRLGKAIQTVYESLDSHIPYCYGKDKEDVAFHQKCVLDYAKLMVVLARCYK